MIKDSHSDLKKADRDFKRAVQIWESQKLPCGHIFHFDDAELKLREKDFRHYQTKCAHCGKDWAVMVDNSNLIRNTK